MSKAPNGHVKCDGCGKKYPSLFGDKNIRQGKDCASVYSEHFLYGNYGSNIDTDVYQLVYPPKWLKNQSLVCDKCISLLEKNGHLKLVTTGVY